MAATEWQAPSEALFSTAVDKKQAIVFYFEDSSKNDAWLNDVDLTDLSKGGFVVCVKVPVCGSAPAKAKDGDAAASTSKVVPASKVNQDNLWAAYGVKTPGTFVVADQYGNAYNTGVSKKLAAQVSGLGKQVKAVREKMAKSLERAGKSRDKGDVKGAMKELLEVFEHGKTGYTEFTSALEMYNALIEDGRKQLADAADNADRLKALRDAYKKTDLEGDIEAASAKAKEVAMK